MVLAVDGEGDLGGVDLAGSEVDPVGGQALVADVELADGKCVCAVGVEVDAVDVPVVDEREVALAKLLMAGLVLLAGVS